MQVQSASMPADVAPRRGAETRPIRVGLLGLGTVGSGVFNVLARNQRGQGACRICILMFTR